MPGRPRDPQLDDRLLEAAWSLLTTEGYDALSLTKVASRAQAHRSDVYRRWASKAQLVADVLAEHLPPVSPVDTGALASDIRAYLDQLAASWSSSWIDGLVGFLGDLRDDPDAELAFRLLGEGRGHAMRSALLRAVERGELEELPDVSLAGDLLEGPLMHRRLIGRQPLTADYLDALAVTTHRLLVSGQVVT